MSSNRKSVIKKILGAEVNIKSIQKATAAKLAKVDAINKELEERKRDEDMESPAIAATVARIKLQNLLNKSDKEFEAVIDTVREVYNKYADGLIGDPK